jgi:CubicO group peptidase (beta-lactamase class C family)
MQETTSIDAARISDTVSKLVEKHHLPGIAVGVVSGEELMYAEGFGWADIESKRPQAPEVRQRIGSITKTMVGLSAMALVEEGRLRLEDRVVDLLPDMT